MDDGDDPHANFAAIQKSFAAYTGPGTDASRARAEGAASSLSGRHQLRPATRRTPFPPAPIRCRSEYRAGHARADKFNSQDPIHVEPPNHIKNPPRPPRRSQMHPIPPAPPPPPPPPPTNNNKPERAPRPAGQVVVPRRTPGIRTGETGPTSGDTRTVNFQKQALVQASTHTFSHGAGRDLPKDEIWSKPFEDNIWSLPSEHDVPALHSEHGVQSLPSEEDFQSVHNDNADGVRASPSGINSGNAKSTSFPRTAIVEASAGLGYRKPNFGAYEDPWSSTNVRGHPTVYLERLRMELLGYDRIFDTDGPAEWSLPVWDMDVEYGCLLVDRPRFYMILGSGERAGIETKT